VRILNKFLLPVFCSLIIFGCGGGSAGTGTVSLSGKLLNPQDEPVSGAIVTIVETGETAVTDANGNFSIETNTAGQEVALQVESEEVTATVSVSTATQEDSKVGVQLEVDNERSTVSVRNYEVSLEIKGLCGKAFSKSGTTYLQTQAIKDGTTCRLSVTATERGEPLSGISVQLQRRSCEADSEWLGVSTASTAFTDPPGVADLQFRFRADDAHCAYRVVAPYRDSSRAPLFFELITLIQLSRLSTPAS